MATTPFLSPLAHTPQAQADTVELIDALRINASWARAVFYDRHASEVTRVLASVLGPDSELADLVQETFVEAFQSIGRLRDRAAVGAWLRQIAVNRARSCIRRRRRQRWFALYGLGDTSEPEATIATPEQREAVAETYRILGELSDKSPGRVRASPHRGVRARRCRGGVRRLARDNQTSARSGGGSLRPPRPTWRQAR